MLRPYIVKLVQTLHPLTCGSISHVYLAAGKSSFSERAVPFWDCPLQIDENIPAWNGWGGKRQLESLDPIPAQERLLEQVTQDHDQLDFGYVQGEGLQNVPKSTLLSSIGFSSMSKSLLYPGSQELVPASRSVLTSAEWVKEKDHLSSPAGSTPSNAAQDTIGLLHDEGT